MILSAIGIPFPSSLTLLATGSFVAQGELALVPVIVVSSIAYPWRWFLLWGISGEILWVVLYVSLGLIFSDQVVVIFNFLGDLSWAHAGLLVTGASGWKLFAKPKVTPLNKND